MSNVHKIDLHAFIPSKNFNQFFVCLFFSELFAILINSLTVKEHTDQMLIDAFLSLFSFRSGPETWAQFAPAAAGSKQSPINIRPSEAVLDPQLMVSPLRLTYKASEAQKLVNTGSSVQVTYSGQTSSETLFFRLFFSRASALGTKRKERFVVNSAHTSTCSACFLFDSLGRGSIEK